MSDKTSIEWTATVNPDGTVTPGSTWNPVRGCTKVSPGCAHCYAETFAERFRGVPGHPYEQGFDLRLVPEKLTEPLRWKKPRRVFVNSMSDLFQDGVPDEYIDRVFAVMALAPRHTFQVLTKRAERMRAYLTAKDRREDVGSALWKELKGGPLSRRERITHGAMRKWPLPNVWLGVSTENQPMYDKRIRDLLLTPAAVRFLSVEPMLSPIDLRMGGMSMPEYSPHNPLPSIDWLIVGGESGHGARAMHPDWARSIRDQCQAAGVAFFFKQWGEFGNGSSGAPANSHRIVLTDGRAFTWEEYAAAFGQTPDGLNPTIMARVGKKAAGRLLDGREWNEFPRPVSEVR